MNSIVPSRWNLAALTHFLNSKIAFLALALMLMAGCSWMKVAEYDQQVNDQILETAEKVDRFWNYMAALPDSSRTYAEFKTEYAGVESEIKLLLLRQHLRQFNELSINQTQKLLELWQDDIKQHKEKDGFSDFIIKRRQKQYFEVFVAIARGEQAKNSK